jgi:hypothetical protein
MEVYKWQEDLVEEGDKEEKKLADLREYVSVQNVDILYHIKQVSLVIM